MADEAQATMFEELVSLGSTIKALGDGRVGGHLVLFSGPDTPDLDGDFFTSETDFDIPQGGTKTTTVYYHHGLDPVLKRRKLGRGEIGVDEIGVWITAQLDMRDAYERAVYQMVEQGKAGWSSGTLPNLVEREQTGKAWHIKSWPLGGDASITVTPADPRQRVLPLKAVDVVSINPLADEPAQPEAQTPEASEADAGNSAAAVQEPVPSTEQTAEQTPPEETTIMPDNIQVTERAPEQAAPVETNAFEAKLAQMESAFSAKIDAVLKALENEPAARKAGYVTDDGGAADTHVKSFGDWLLAVRRGDTKRLTTVYKSASAKDMGEDSGVMGGYTVPEEFMPRLLEAMGDTAVVRGRAEVIPVSSDAGFIPALDQFTAPTAGVGNTAFAGGVTADPALSGSEGGTLTETQPTFKKLEYRIHKIGDYVEVDSELIADSPLAIETLLTRLFGRAVAAKEDYYFLRGTGVGAPLGILNAPCAIGVDADSDNAWTDADALEMISRFRPNTNRCYWIMHPSMIPDLATFEVGTGGSVYLSDQTVRPGSIPLFGYPILFSEHLPQADTAGCVILADLGSYMIFDRQNLAIAYSEHVNFKSDQGVWRYTKRFDGKPWQISTITLADPQGSFTVSPFVYNND